MLEVLLECFSRAISSWVWSTSWKEDWWCSRCPIFATLPTQIYRHVNKFYRISKQFTLTCRPSIFETFCSMSLQHLPTFRSDQHLDWSRRNCRLLQFLSSFDLLWLQRHGGICRLRINMGLSKLQSCCLCSLWWQPVRTFSKLHTPWSTSDEVSVGSMCVSRDRTWQQLPFREQTSEQECKYWIHRTGNSPKIYEGFDPRYSISRQQLPKMHNTLPPNSCPLLARSCFHKRYEFGYLARMNDNLYFARISAVFQDPMLAR